MDDWVLWLVAAVLLGVGEILTTSFYLAPFALGAAVATIVSALGGGFVLAGAVFLVVSAGALLTLRPIARRHLRTPASLRTGTAALVGRTATVVEQVTPDAGCVKLEGEVWTARPYDEDGTIAPGTRVHVIEIRGATALVSE
ncbi:MAG TPA: NfeD family protein [Solirubrobacteraceae bacterium]|nr:NfeD family protein [Solirubrobacteraceae bacterium]